MSSNDKKQSEPTKVARVSGFDKGPVDFFRGSRGTFGKMNFKSFNTKSFVGMRRGSK